MHMTTQTSNKRKGGIYNRAKQDTIFWFSTPISFSKYVIMFIITQNMCILNWIYKIIVFYVLLQNQLCTELIAQI